MSLQVEQKLLRPGNIVNVSYFIADNRYRTALDLSRDFETRCRHIVDNVAHRLLIKKFPPYESRAFGFYGDVDKHNYDIFSKVDNALIYIIDCALNNAMDVIFEKMQGAKFIGEIGLSSGIENGWFVATVSDNGFGFPQQELELLALGQRFESHKGKISEEERIRIRQEFENPNLTWSEKDDLSFAERGRQKGESCRGIRKSAALAVAHGGMLEIVTHNRDGQTFKLAFGENGMTDKRFGDLNIYIPFGVLSEGKRLTVGTTYLIRFPVK